MLPARKARKAVWAPKLLSGAHFKRHCLPCKRILRSQPMIEARLHMTLGVSFLLLSEPRIAAEQFERARAIYEEQVGADNADTLESMNNLAVAYADSGRDDEAAEAARRNTGQSGVPRSAPITSRHALGSMRNLANSYMAANRLQDAARPG